MRGNNVYCIFWNIQTSFAAWRPMTKSNWINETNRRKSHRFVLFSGVFSSKLIVASCFTLALNSERQIDWPSALIFGPWGPWQYGLAEVRGAIMMEHNWHEWRLCLYVFIVGVSKVDSRIPLAVNWTWPSNASMMEFFLVFRAWMVVERTWEYIQCRTLSAVSKDHNDHVTGNTWSSTYGLIWFHLKSRRLCIDLVYTNCAYLTYFASCSMEIYLNILKKCPIYIYIHIFYIYIISYIY